MAGRPAVVHLRIRPAGAWAHTVLGNQQAGDPIVLYRHEPPQGPEFLLRGILTFIEDEGEGLWALSVRPQKEVPRGSCMVRMGEWMTRPPSPPDALTGSSHST